MVSRRNSIWGQEQNIEIEDHSFRRVSQFKYLGSRFPLNQYNDVKTEVSSRIQ